MSLISGSKTDQLDRGAVRNQFRSEELLLCEVNSAIVNFKAFPSRYIGGTKAAEPIGQHADSSATILPWRRKCCLAGKQRC